MTFDLRLKGCRLTSQQPRTAERCPKGRGGAATCRAGVAQLEKREEGVQEEAQLVHRSRGDVRAGVGLHKSPGQQEDRAEARARPPLLKGEEPCGNQRQAAGSRSLITGS